MTSRNLRSLNVFLPAQLPPNVVRLIEDFYGATNSLVGKMIRLCILNVLHDAFVVREEPMSVIVLVRPGASLRIPRSDIGGMSWGIGPDTNPHRASSLTAEWFATATQRPRLEECGAIEVHFVSNEKTKSCHRRVRCFALNENKCNPTRPPMFVYTKMSFPYFALKGVQSLADNRMREQAAYDLLPLCTPSVAPMCHYAKFNEETGSYCIVMEDIVNWLKWQRISSSTEAETSTYVPQLKRIAFLLAVLHGRFLDDTKADDDDDAAAAQRHNKGHVDGKLKELYQGMVHSHIYYALWKEVLPATNVELQGMLAAVFGVPMEASNHIARPKQKQQVDGGGDAASTPPRDSTTAATDADKHSVASPAAAETTTTTTPDATPAARRSIFRSRSLHGGAATQIPKADLHPASHAKSSLTLVHGRLNDSHIRLHTDPKRMPNALLLDWKFCGIGPLEIDLLQLMLLIPRPVRHAHPEVLLQLLEEYTSSMWLLYRVTRRIPDLMCAMRDIAFILVGSAPFDWNDDGNLTNEITALHLEMAERTTRAQIQILEEQLKAAK